MTSQKAALIIGINYHGTTSQLNGCINDAVRLKNLLMSDLHYESDNITLLVDQDGSDDLQKPTRDNITQQIRNLAEKATTDNLREIWITFSGHGSYCNDYSQDESDGRDELLVPCDYQTAGCISDDQWSQLLSLFPSFCRVFNIFDCCHSGTLADLNHHYYFDYIEGEKIKTGRKRIRKKVRVRGRWRWRREWQDQYEVQPPRWEWKTRTENSTQSISAHVLTLSGCKDPQTSADAYLRDREEWGGALTNAFCNLLADSEGKLTCQDMCKQLNLTMKKTKMKQRPTLACNKTIRPNDIFIICPPRTFIQSS